MATQNVFVLLALASLLAMTNVIATRDLAIMKPGYKLAARLDQTCTEGLVPCWNALIELKSCSNEVIIFFLNGQTDIGADCCRAISVITHNCWPSMLTSLGFTAEEGNILRGYCDAAAAHAAAPLTSSVLVPRA